MELTPVSLLFLDQVGLPLAAGALLPSANIMLTPSIAGALMGISSLGVMTNSLLLQLEFSRPSSNIHNKSQAGPVVDPSIPNSTKQESGEQSQDKDVELGLGSQEPRGKFSH